MVRERSGFSLAELLVAMAIASLLAAMMFQLFGQNERVVRDQTLIAEMQQTARIVLSQIADEVRMAGQGLPVYAAAFDPTPSEAAAVFLSSCTANRIDFRAALSNVETAPSPAGPVTFTIGTSRMLPVMSAAGFPAGRFVYLTGPTGSGWNWLRAELTAVSAGSLTLLPRNSGDSDPTVHFDSSPAIDLEEAVSIYLSAGSVRRAAAVDTTNPAAPVWSPANEIGRHVTALQFMYYDAYGMPVQPTTLANRSAIARVDIRITVETAGALSNGTRPVYSLSLRTIPRNLRLRPGPV